MNLYYDRVSKMYSLDCEDGSVEFLGPATHAMVVLKSKYDLTDSQAREAVLQAVFNMGDAVNISTIKKIAGNESVYYAVNH